MKLFASVICAVLVVSAGGTHAQQQMKLIDPASVAPEHREAAAKRRAEQLKLQACIGKADAAKVLPRERAQFVGKCLDAEQH